MSQGFRGEEEDFTPNSFEINSESMIDIQLLYYKCHWHCSNQIRLIPILRQLLPTTITHN